VGSLKVLVTCAWPYAYSIPHLGNLIGSVLSADVIARYHKLKGDEVVFVSGSDEHGTPIEVEAIQRNKKPKELTDEIHAKIKKIFEDFEISFSNYTRTESEIHKEFVREFYRKVYKNGFIFFEKVTQLYCEKDKIFLPDRFVIGTCPFCNYEKARGDQCENCGNLLEPTQLINPKCVVCGSTPSKKETEHCFIDFPKLRDRVIEYINNNPYFDKRIKAISLGYIKDEFRARALTRDNKWGIPAPFENFEDKTIYVWFEAVLGYISATIEYFKDDRWKEYWFNKNALTYYFIGKDNIPFHAVIFPALLMASGEDYNLPHIISATEFLTYEGKKFSKSQGIGIWLDEALQIAESDYWRYALVYLRPEERDTEFSIKIFVELVNSHLNDTLGNLVYRVLTFVKNYFNYCIPKPKELNDEEKEILNKVENIVKEIDSNFKEVKLRNALNLAMEIARIGNWYLNEKKPWEKVKTNKEEASRIIYVLARILHVLTIVLHPIIPKKCEEIRKMLNLPLNIKWEDAFYDPFKEEQKISEPKIIFRKYSIEEIENKLREIRKVSI